ncbi:MAG: hypothetical protein ACYS18_06765 [Planctomycetota bacterium]|jgi:hypothetical protein
MKSRFYFVFVVFYFTAVAIFTVYLRSASDRTFYRLCLVHTQKNRLKQQLVKKQLQLEAMINPAAVFQSIDDDEQNN